MLHSGEVAKAPTVSKFKPSQPSSPCVLSVSNPAQRLKYEIPHILLTVENKRTVAALDSGSSVTAISHAKFLQLRKDRPALALNPSIKSITVANAESLSPLGWTHIKLKLNGKTRSVKVDVIPNFMFDLLIGWPHMKQWGTTLNTATNTATVGGECFPFLRTSQRAFQNPHMYSIVSTETIRVPASSSMLVSSKVLNCDDGAIPSGVVLTDPTIAEQAALFVAKGIPLVDECGNTEVLIANMGSEDVQLPSETQVGFLATKDEYDTVDADVLCNITELADEPSDVITKKIRQWINDPSSKEIPGLDLSQTILSPKEQEQLQAVLSKLSDRFVSNNQRPGQTSLVQVEIDTGNAKPINQAPYPRGPAQRQFIEETLNENLKGGIIRKSTSPWASPVCIIRKKDGYFRFAIDIGN